MPRITTSLLMTPFRYRPCWPEPERIPAQATLNRMISVSAWFPLTSRNPRLREKSRPHGLPPRREAVVLDRISGRTAKEGAAPHIEMNEKYLGGPSPDRLIVARLMPTYVPLPSIEPVARKEKPETLGGFRAQDSGKNRPKSKGRADLKERKDRKLKWLPGHKFRIASNIVRKRRKQTEN